MARHSGYLLKQLQHLATPAPEGELSDADLLEQFLSRSDEQAFAALLRRHGPLRWTVCQRELEQRA
jgi:hypothetical protein